jgi:hypothetical protein
MLVSIGTEEQVITVARLPFTILYSLFSIHTGGAERQQRKAGMGDDDEVPVAGGDAAEHGAAFE